MSSRQPIPDFFKTLAAILVTFIAAGYLAILFKEILVPLLFAFLFAILLLPLADALERFLRLPRSAAASLSVLILILFIAMLFSVVGTQISRLSDDWPLFQQQLNATLDSLQQWIKGKFNIDLQKQSDYAHETLNKMLSSTTSMVGATVLSVSSILLLAAFTMINTFFILFYRRLIVRFLLALFTEENSKLLYDIISQVQHIIRRYVTGLLIEMAVVAGVSCTALSILGVRYAILLGLVTGLFNIIPYIGIFTALTLSALITFATAGSLPRTLLVVITLLVIHLFDSNVLFPLVVGSKVRINAFITLLGVIVGEILWGIPGMFLAIPAIGTAKIIFDRIEPLKPWGMLFGDEKDETNPGKLSRMVRKGKR